MSEVQKSTFTLARLGANGEIVLPKPYRDSERLTAGASLALVQVGDALLLAPIDDQFQSLTGRLEAAMDASGTSVEELIAAAAEARKEIVQEEFEDRD
jgi:bifunctional DNA-binding transcriptional regulator/antitoxin component of YhaV-PrlF toxin-antitoxin module